jgi:hypothetical protein
MGRVEHQPAVAIDRNLRVRPPKLKRKWQLGDNDVGVAIEAVIHKF